MPWWMGNECMDILPGMLSKPCHSDIFNCRPAYGAPIQYAFMETLISVYFLPSECRSSTITPSAFSVS